MAGVIQYFRDEFLCVHKDGEYVDLSSLVNKLNNFTPIPLRCTKPEESVKYVISERKKEKERFLFPIFFTKMHIFTF